MRHTFVTCAAATAAAFSAPIASAGEGVADMDCSATDIVVYFSEDESKLTPQAEAMLDLVAEQANPCMLTSVETEAWAGDAGTSARASSLAEARRMSLLSALAERGLVARAHVQLPGDLNERDRTMPIGRSVYATLRLSFPSVG